jgi:hypothetical protein
MITYDLQQISLGCPYPSGSHLERDLPHSVFKGTWEQYGWWWHYLLDRTAGWWNNYKHNRTPFRNVVAMALGVELSTAGINPSFGKLNRYAAAAFASKGWNEGFYPMIGSRASVFSRVNVALYGSAAGGTYNLKFERFEQMIHLDETQYHMQGWGSKILSRDFTPEELLAYEWGNPTPSSPAEFLGKLRRFSNMGPEPDHILYFSDIYKGPKETHLTTTASGSDVYTIAFVVTLAQMTNLCKGAPSCVGQYLPSKRKGN